MGGFGGAGAFAEDDDATWFFRFYPDVPWTTAGGDFDPASSATTTIDLNGTYTFSGSGLIADVQAWIDGDENHGWVLIGDEIQPKSARKIASREYADSSRIPMLSVEYEAPGRLGDLNGDDAVDGRDDARARRGAVVEDRRAVAEQREQHARAAVREPEPPPAVVRRDPLEVRRARAREPRAARDDRARERERRRRGHDRAAERGLEERRARQRGNVPRREGTFSLTSRNAAE